jgi:predicted AAA+ superfamily ATPase
MLTDRILLSRINNLKKSLLLIGPRQTGKSTLIKNLKPDLEINFADQEVFLQHMSQPGLIKNLTKSHKKIFIDEVQRIPSILNTIQVIIDNDKTKQFFLTGSSARKLKKGQANLLPGRIVSYELGPLTHEELKDDFELEKALARGLLPGIYHEESEKLSEKILTSYASTYLKEEVQAEALTRNLEGFSRFFQLIASRSGDFTDFSKFSSAAMIERTTAKRYFDVLVDTLIINPVEAFAKSSRRRLIQHPKFYFFDVGVLNGCLNNFKPSADRIGNLFEHLFFQLLLSSAKSHDDNIRVSVYRTDAGAEVDFIVEKNNELFAVEIKATKNIGRHDLNGLKSFADYYGKNHRSIVVYLGDNHIQMDGIDILPLISAMKELGY